MGLSASKLPSGLGPGSQEQPVAVVSPGVSWLSGSSSDGQIADCTDLNALSVTLVLFYLETQLPLPSPSSGSLLSQEMIQERVKTDALLQQGLPGRGLREAAT